MNIQQREKVVGWFFILPTVLGFILFLGGPFLLSIYYSFTKGIGATEFVGFENYKSLLASSSFQRAAVNTIRFIGVGVPLITVISLFFAFLLNMKIKAIPFFRTVFITPLVVPVASVIVVWQIVFQNKGILNGLLHAIGLAEVSWLSEGWSFVILISLYIWKNCGYNIVLFLSGLSNIPKEYYESAYIDGAGNWACFRNITLPLLVPTLFFVFIMSLINSFKVFKEAFLLAGSYPPLDIYMLQHFMNNNFRNLNFQRLSTAAFLVLIIITLLVSAVYRVDKNYGQ